MLKGQKRKEKEARFEPLKHNILLNILSTFNFAEFTLKMFCNIAPRLSLLFSRLAAKPVSPKSEFLEVPKKMIL